MTARLSDPITGFAQATTFAWPIVQMRDICKLHYGKALKTDARVSGTIPVYGSNGRTGWHNQSLSTGPSIVLGRKGQGNLGVEWVEGPFWVIDTAYYITFEKVVDPRYLYYFTEYVGLNHLKDGTSNPSLSRDVFNVQPIPLPPLDIQRGISSTLSAFDDKIELNRQMNETLEGMAQAIFRDWFVDFGPVRRKLAGETDPVAIMGGLTTDPARAAELAALFPAELGDRALPISWAEEPVIDQANWVNGAAYKKMHFVRPGEGLPVVKIAELKAGVTNNTGFTNTDLGSRYRIDDGELLFSWSGNPDTSIDTFIWTGGPAWLNQHIFAVRPNGTRTLGFLFAMLKHLKPTFAEIARDKQTTGLGHVTKEDLKRLRQVVPNTSVEMAFDALMTPIFEKLKAAQLENRTLAETRDYLLPRLMSGEVRVGGGEAMVA
jgi:type I restriction enzyme S subunit